MALDVLARKIHERFSVAVFGFSPPGIIALVGVTNARWPALLALIASLPTTTAVRQTPAAERAVAVTFDDLPATPAGLVANDVASLTEVTRKLLNAVRRYGVPAVGFVNEGKLSLEGARPGDVEGRTAVLRMWLDAGLELGNHTYSHGDLNTMPLEQFEADVLRGEAVTRGLMKTKGQTLRYFPSSTSAQICRSVARSRHFSTGTAIPWPQ